MSTQVQLRRGTAAQHATFVGAPGEITVDTTNNTLRVHDGITPGGHPLTLQALFDAHLAENTSHAVLATRDLSIPGEQIISLIPNRTAKKITIYAAVGGQVYGSWGVRTPEAERVFAQIDSGTMTNLTASIFIRKDSTNNMTGRVLIESGQIKINWTVTGTMSGNVQFIVIADYHGDG